MKKLYFTIAALLLPIAGHGIMAIAGNEDARFFSSLEYADCFADRFRFWVFDRVRSRRFEKEA